MKCPIKNLPVKFNERFEIVDSKGNIVVPTLTWKADWAHQRHQALLGVFIEHLINIYGAEMEDFQGALETGGGLTELKTPPTIEK